MWPVPGGYGETLVASHGLRVFADVWRAGQPVRWPDGSVVSLPITGGSITVDRTQSARRSINITVPPFLRSGTYTQVPALPSLPSDVLGHYGQELRVRHALVAADGTLLVVPVGRFRIDSGAGSDLGLTEVTIAGVSREAYVVDDIFTAPRTFSNPSGIAIIRQLILETLPDAEVAVLTRRDRRVTPTTWDDRWTAISELAASLSVQVYADPTGRFVITDLPTLATKPVWRFQPQAGGSLLEAARTSSRTGVYNRVAVQGSTPDGATVATTGVDWDKDPTSPTFYGDPDTGAYGKVTKVVSMPSLTTLADCQAAASTQLALSTGGAESLDLATIPHAGLEALDVVEIVTDPGRVFATARRHMVDNFTLPLVPGGQFSVATRDVGAVTDS
ncbi:hypothetical protein GCM10025864_44570 [Luteimicrobium album]|uniref:DUF5047 domain-containing protein n=1 Tax=Luteimicrobium album TaxID=1054550 RepID=A0ABQ6I7D7_9MICO|nr:DUF5047 domain-containing protein [Luteimicrobium album]GMA22292.1 hypothetical protein GCM10025864_00510 [Luteimicrobium album]GMA26698.1 hypothetical protein GCM10025864_44570 [Luteimicrobium album]